MKILHLIPTYKPAYIYGGPIFSISLLCEQLAKAGCEVRMLTTTANGPDELDVPIGKKVNVDGVETIYFRRLTKDHSHLSPGLMRQVWQDCRRYDVVHIHSWWNIPVMFSVLACWLRGVRPVLSPRGMLSDFTFQKNSRSPKAIFHRTIGKFLLRKTHLHLTSEAERQECLDISDDSFVLPNLIQTAESNFLQNLKNEVFTIAFLSRIHPKKNLEGLFGALEKVSFDFRLRIAGMGEEAYLEALKKLAASKGLAEKMEWTGELHGDKKFRFYANADLFVLPSFNENFANVVIEVLSAGTPVLISEQVGLSSYIRENGLGWTCGTDATGIAEKLEEIFASKNELETIRVSAPQVIERDFSPKILTRRYIEQYKKLRKNA